MSTTVRLFVILALLGTACRAQGQAPATRLSDGRTISFNELVVTAQHSDVVLIGESHDEVAHHQMELAVIRSLWERKVPFAIGLEMMQTDSQRHLDDWTAGRIDESTMRAIYAANWTLDWAMYREIFLFARDHHIPMVGLNVRQDIVSKVAHNGFASLTREERQGLPEGTSCDLKNPHTAFLKKAFQNVARHMAESSMFTYFCEAQTLRNSGMALNIARYLEKHPDRKLVGLTGIWHAVKNAIPEQLGRNGSNLACLVILPEIPEAPAGIFSADTADYLLGL